MWAHPLPRLRAPRRSQLQGLTPASPQPERGEQCWGWAHRPGPRHRGAFVPGAECPSGSPRPRPDRFVSPASGPDSSAPVARVGPRPRARGSSLTRRSPGAARAWGPTAGPQDTMTLVDAEPGCQSRDPHRRGDQQRALGPAATILHWTHRVHPWPWALGAHECTCTHPEAPPSTRPWLEPAHPSATCPPWGPAQSRSSSPVTPHTTQLTVALCQGPVWGRPGRWDGDMLRPLHRLGPTPGSIYQHRTPVSCPWGGGVLGHHVSTPEGAGGWGQSAPPPTCQNTQHRPNYTGIVGAPKTKGSSVPT